MIEIKSNISLKAFNTFGVDALAKHFIEINCKDDLLYLLDNPMFRNEKYLVIGCGANILFSSDFDGIIIKSNINNIEIVDENDDYVYVNVGSGTVWNDFVAFAVKNSLSGIENLIDIPSQCGSAAVQNIGAYGMEACETIESVCAVEMFGKHNERCFSNADCDFGYRHSTFKEKENIGKYYITSVLFKLRRNFSPRLTYKELAEHFAGRNTEDISISDMCNVVSNIRKAKLPDYRVHGNAGSFFKNPVVMCRGHKKLFEKYTLNMYEVKKEGHVKLSAAQLIEIAGFKGYIVDNVGMSEKHALVLCNYGNATGRDIVSYYCLVILNVFLKTGVLLEPEVIVVS